MTDSDKEYGDKESQERFEAALKGAMKTPPKPLKSMTPKRAKPQPKKPEKPAS